MKTIRRKQINKNEYLQAVGLITLAKKHNESLRQIEDALCGILDAEKGGHCSDCVFGELYQIDTLLEYLDIEFNKDTLFNKPKIQR